MIRTAKKAYYHDQFNQCKHDLKRTWKLINSTINNGPKFSKITKLMHNDAIVEDKVQMANIFNNYFSQVGFNLARRIPTTHRSFHQYLGDRNQSSIFFSPTNAQEIIKIIYIWPKTK